MIALITGANSGIGLITAQELAKAAFELILLVRSQSKADETKKAILEQAPNAKLDFFLVDLEDLQQVKAVGAQIAAKYPTIDRLINNAGYSPSQIEMSADGIEKSFVANHLGHFVLTHQLWNAVENAEEGRVINVASEAYQMGKASRMLQKNNLSISKMAAYGDGKLANILFAKGLAKRLKKASAYSLHPGVVNTNFGSKLNGLFGFMWKLIKPFTISPAQGAKTSIYLATAPYSELKAHNGAFFSKSKPKNIRKSDINEQTVEKLWADSERFL